MSSFLVGSITHDSAQPTLAHQVTVAEVTRPLPELLAPAGSLDAVRAAFANGADAVYLGVGRFNARDEGAQLSLDDLAQACRIAHGRGGRVYLTLNTLVKQHELTEALELLGACVDHGIDAVLMQDVGLITLARQVYPALAIHGSTQMSVHDASGARVVRELGVERVVLARENSLDDVREIRATVDDIGLETFIHGALCIAYSGQCFMSGMISERSANRGSCAQSCRKDYVLADSDGTELDRGYLISAKDLGAYDHLQAIADAGVGCLKIEGRKKKPEYVATVTRAYRDFLSKIERGVFEPPVVAETEPLVQIFSRGFTGGMFGGRVGREYVTRTHPDNRGLEIGTVVSCLKGELVVEVRTPVRLGDGLGFEPPGGASPAQTVGFAVRGVRELGPGAGGLRQALDSPMAVPSGWVVVRTADASLLSAARASFEAVTPVPSPRDQVSVRAFGSAGGSLKLVFATHDDAEVVESAIPLRPATDRPLDEAALRRQLGRLGETAFTLGGIDVRGLALGLFLPLSELNHLRQRAVSALAERITWSDDARRGARTAKIAAAATVARTDAGRDSTSVQSRLIVEVWRVEDARTAAAAGATEVVIDPFLRHPAPPKSRILALQAELGARGVALRLRTPSIMRPADRPAVEPWLALGLPLLSGHLGLVAERGGRGDDIVADYATNCFNRHSARELFRRGARRLTPSVELTAVELAALVEPWGGAGFDVFTYGRPEGMTIEHCVLSAAFNREPTTCRDLCVQSHPSVELTDPTGYTFPVATDSDCRNRLLHSRPVDGSSYLATLWAAGIRGFRLVFNVPGDDVAGVTAAYRTLLDSVAAGGPPAVGAVREVVGDAYTRGHFARAV